MRFLIAILCAASLCACSVPSFSPSASPVYYVLQSPQAVPSVSSPFNLSIMPPLLPGYLERSQLVSRNEAGSEIQVHSFDLWGEELSQGIVRVMCDAFACRGIAAMPLSSRISAPKKLNLDLRRFDGSPNGNVHMDAIWTIVQDGSAPYSARFTAEEYAGSDLNSMVKAMSRLAERLAESIAAAMHNRGR